MGLPIEQLRTHLLLQSHPSLMPRRRRRAHALAIVLAALAGGVVPAVAEDCTTDDGKVCGWQSYMADARFPTLDGSQGTTTFDYATDNTGYIDGAIPTEVCWGFKTTTDNLNADHSRHPTTFHQYGEPSARAHDWVNLRFNILISKFSDRHDPDRGSSGIQNSADFVQNAKRIILL